MLVRNCTFDGTTPALRIKSGVDRGGTVTDVTYQNCTLKNVSIAIELNMVYDPKNGPAASRPDGQRSVPHVKEIVFRNITATGAKQAIKIAGLQEAPIEDVTFENVKIDADTGVNAEYAKGIVFKNVDIQVKKGEPVVTKDAEIKRE
jgi:polygalacturonase